VKNFILLLLLFFNASILANNQDWKLAKNKDGIKVYQIQKNGFRLKHQKASTIINASIPDLLAVLSDNNSCSMWIYHCISNQMISQPNSHSRIYYTVIDSPLFFKDRDMYLLSQITFNTDNQQALIELKPFENNANEHKDRVRIKEISMFWTLTPINENQTNLVYEVYVEPLIPFKRIVNKFILDSLYYTLKKVTKAVKISNLKN
jgi:hypothetical protein